ncbi:cupin domain-containing protein [Haloglomus litoreum]|uniref:cupin domain-containing protein n=1 Tax=Haloglomus litoreum TaxID=3034026 RepID=UPI0023E87C4E|nr:cupin domain-containing protein [Haloglomus sp. DT116]
MEKVAIDDVETQNSPLGVHSLRKPVSSALGTEHFAMNYFELQPEESFSGGLHTHHDQEEVFYVMEGSVEFEVGLDRETVLVEAGEVIRFEPGEYQTGWNRGDEDVRGWALGAPGAQHDWDELESVVDCRECGEETPHATTINEEGRFAFTCNECGTSFSM